MSGHICSGEGAPTFVRPSRGLNLTANMWCFLLGGHNQSRGRYIRSYLPVCAQTRLCLSRKCEGNTARKQFLGRAVFLLYVDKSFSCDSKLILCRRHHIYLGPWSTGTGSLIGVVLYNSISDSSLLKSLPFLSVGLISYPRVTLSGLITRTLIHFEEQVFPDFYVGISMSRKLPEVMVMSFRSCLPVVAVFAKLCGAQGKADGELVRVPRPRSRTRAHGLIIPASTPSVG